MTLDTAADEPFDEDDPPRTPEQQARDQRRQERMHAIFVTWYEPLYTCARFLGTREPADVEDAVQTTFLSLLHERGDLLDETDDPAGQARQLVKHLYKSVRGRMLNWRRDEDGHDQVIGQITHLLHPTPLGQPDLELEAAELARCAREVIRRLPRQERRVFRCIRFEGMTLAATGALLGISTGTVQVYLARATQKLLLALAPYLPLSYKPVLDGLSIRKPVPRTSARPAARKDLP
jgi:RNA polymerase sigma factor (sigma-70 family)